MAVRSYTDGTARLRYVVEFEQRGRRVHKRLPAGSTQAQAREWKTQLRREAFDEEQLGHEPEILLSDVIQRWLNTRPHADHTNVVSKANTIAELVFGKTVAQVPAVARDVQEKFAHLKPASINKKRAVLKAALTWHGRPDLSRQIKLRAPKNQKEVYATKEQLRAIADGATDPKIEAAIILLAYTGLRCGELLDPALSIHHGALLVPDSKSGKPRTVPLGPTARAYLKELPLGITYWQLNGAFCNARDAAGVSKTLTLHGLRHTYASWLINDGANLLQVAQLLGHTSVYVTARYAHLYHSTLKNAVDALG